MKSCNMTPREIIEYFFAHNPELQKNSKGLVFNYDEFVEHTPPIMMAAFNEKAVEKVDGILGIEHPEIGEIDLETAIDLVMESFVTAVSAYIDVENEVAEIIENMVKDVLKDSGVDPADINVKATMVDEETYKMMTNHPGKNALLN